MFWIVSILLLYLNYLKQRLIRLFWEYGSPYLHLSNYVLYQEVMMQCKKSGLVNWVHSAEDVRHPVKHYVRRRFVATDADQETLPKKKKFYFQCSPWVIHLTAHKTAHKTAHPAHPAHPIPLPSSQTYYYHLVHWHTIPPSPFHKYIHSQASYIYLCSYTRLH